MPYALGLCILVLLAGLGWGCLNLRRQGLGRRELNFIAAQAANGSGSVISHLGLQAAKLVEIPVRSSEAGMGVEYFFLSRVGLLAIIPHRDLASAVELYVEGKLSGNFISAEFAAESVALGLTRHEKLDALSKVDRPHLLKDWEQSAPRHFRT
jgi:hypothetical protein